ncbi:MAG TPA: hypothetical protein VI756_11740 [Blastocatellia bacterium]
MAALAFAVGGFSRLKAGPRGNAVADTIAPNPVSSPEKPYGSGHFGEWIQDEFGLPAFRYTCDQIHDPKAATKVNPGILSSTEHIHQVGNDRIIAVVSNFGYVRVRQDEGAPKFLNDYAPERGYYGGGIGYLTDGKSVLSTVYPGGGQTFERIFGTGYFRKKLANDRYAVDQVILSPFGDDPVLLSRVQITNTGTSDLDLRWIEYWGCQPYEFSFRSFIESFAGVGFARLRRDFGDLFKHEFQILEGNSGLIETKSFLGRPKSDEARWQGVVSFLRAHPNPFISAPPADAAKDASFDDIAPPPTFLVSLDAQADDFSTDGKEFFGSGGVENPSGLNSELGHKLNTTGPGSGFLLERKFHLRRGETRTLSFLYGYLPDGFELKALVRRYRDTADAELTRSCAEWKHKGMRLGVDSLPWVNRETIWNHYYVRSSLTYDSYFKQHILSQGSVYQYVMGFQGAARDPLQHVLPFIFSDPGIVTDILRYTLKEVRPDGSIPYGIVGHGMTMPTTSDYSSDIPMWLLWVASEYVLATRDLDFLKERIPAFRMTGTTGQTEPVSNLLALCYKHLVEDVGTGEHGLMRMLHDDWNDALVQGWVPQKNLDECLEKGESVLNSAMAAYVFELYARVIAFEGRTSQLGITIRDKAEEHRKAVAAQWTGRWFRRAWLGPTLGWLGEKGLWLEPQPWAIISGAASPSQARELVQTVDELLRRPSPIGAMQLSAGPDMLDTGGFKAGTSITGGIWPSLNQTLIWALAPIDAAMAWDEWKKNSFARQKEVYPDIWYQTWSGTDTINSAISKRPGETTESLGSFGWLDWPVFNVHSHACPLYSAAKLIGLEFTENAVVLAPGLPLESYRLESPLLGLVKSARGYEGWYQPSRGTFDGTIQIRLPKEEAGLIQRAEVNGARVPLATSSDGKLELKGKATVQRPIRWALHRT